MHPPLPSFSTACSRHQRFRHCCTPREIPLCAASLNGTLAWHPPFRIWAPSVAPLLRVSRSSAFRLPALHHCFAFSCPFVLCEAHAYTIGTCSSAFGLPALHHCFAFSRCLHYPHLLFCIWAASAAPLLRVFPPFCAVRGSCLHYWHLLFRIWAPGAAPLLHAFSPFRAVHFPSILCVFSPFCPFLVREGHMIMVTLTFHSSYLLP